MRDPIGIDYLTITKEIVGTNVRHHGFRYDEGRSSLVERAYAFSRVRERRCEQIVIVFRTYLVEELSQLTRESSDAPTEVRGAYRPLWVSNRYVGAEVRIGRYEFNVITKYGVGITSPAAAGSKGLSPTEIVDKATWWEFRNVASFERALQGICDIVVSAGVDWFDKFGSQYDSGEGRK